MEGPTLLAEALRAGVELEAVYLEIGRPTPDGVDPRRLWTVQEGALDRIGDVVAAQGVLAVVAPPATTTEPLSGLVLVLWDLADPGNVGTLIRAAHAAGAAAVLTTPATADVWSPKVVRASAGSLFHLPVREVADPLAELRAAGVRVVASVVTTGTAHDRTDLGGSVAIVIGNEAHGLPDSVVAAADQQVTIAHAGSAESLNAAMAGTVLLFESLRQRRVAATDGGDQCIGLSPLPDDKVPNR